jgi:hypothetical protein
VPEGDERKRLRADPGADFAADLPERFKQSIADAEKLIGEFDAEADHGTNAAATPEYEEIVQLKIKLELETARILSEAARLASELTEAAEALRRQDQER